MFIKGGGRLPRLNARPLWPIAPYTTFCPIPLKAPATQLASKLFPLKATALSPLKAQIALFPLKATI